MLQLADNGAQLLEYLTKAGGATKAEKLEELLSLAELRGGPGSASRLQQLVDRAAGTAATTFDDLYSWTTRLSHRTVLTSAPSPPSQVSAHGFSGADMQHFIEEHTWEFLNIALRLNKNTTLWPPGTSSQIRTWLGQALDNLNPPGTSPPLPIPGTPSTSSAGGFQVQVGSLPGHASAPSGITSPYLRQFFAQAQSSLITIKKRDMRAIWAVLQ